MTSINIFSDTYGCGAYGASTYSNGTCTSSGGGGTSGAGSSSGVLTNTGFDLLLVATIAVTIIFAALIVRFWKRQGKKPAEPNASN